MTCVHFQKHFIAKTSTNWSSWYIYKSWQLVFAGHAWISDPKFWLLPHQRSHCCNFTDGVLQIKSLERKMECFRKNNPSNEAKEISYVVTTQHLHVLLHACFLCYLCLAAAI